MTTITSNIEQATLALEQATLALEAVLAREPHEMTTKARCALACLRGDAVIYGAEFIWEEGRNIRIVCGPTADALHVKGNLFHGPHPDDTDPGLVHLGQAVTP